MKKIIIIFSFFSSYICVGQCKFRSNVEEKERTSIVKVLKENKKNAPVYLQYLYDSLNLNSYVIKVYEAKFENFDDISYESDFLKYLKFEDSSLWLYSIRDKGKYVFATSNKTSDTASFLFLYPQLGNESELLNNITKFTKFNKVCIFEIAGFSGWFVLVHNEIWVLKENGWTEANIYFESIFSIEEFKARLRMVE